MGILPPRGYPILGVLPQLRSDPIRTFRDAADRYGDLVHLKAGPYHGFLLTNPADIKHVLQDNARNYHKSPLFERLRDVIGNGLLTSEDAFWLRQRASRSRRSIANADHDGGCDGGLHGADARALGPTAARGGTIDVVAEMMALTQAIIVRTMFSTDLGATAEVVNRTWPSSIGASARPSGREAGDKPAAAANRRLCGHSASWRPSSFESLPTAARPGATNGPAVHAPFGA